MSPLISIIAPVYNEKESVREFYSQVSKILLTLGSDFEMVFVNDGSVDGSSEILKELRQKDARVKIIEFSRNFGHQIAVKAGIDHAAGQALIIMDADLQDPPQAILELVAKWKEGYDVVYAARAKRAGESFFKVWTAALFYRFLKKISTVDIPLDAGDFRLISRPVADTIKNIREKSPYIRGLVSWVGFRQIGIRINRPARFAGETK